MAIDRKAKFTTMDPDEIEVSEGISIPTKLKPVVANAPKDVMATNAYLSGLVKAGKITTDDVDFLIDSGALQN